MVRLSHARRAYLAAQSVAFSFFTHAACLPRRPVGLPKCSIQGFRALCSARKSVHGQPSGSIADTDPGDRGQPSGHITAGCWNGSTGKAPWDHTRNSWYSSHLFPLPICSSTPQGLSH